MLSSRRFLRNCYLLGRPKTRMIWGIYDNLRFAENPRLSRMVLVNRIIIPKPLIMGVYTPYARLDDGIAASQTREFGHIYRRTFDRMTTNSGRVQDCIVLSMADDLQFLICVKESLQIIMYPPR